MRWFLAAGLCAGLLAVAFFGCSPQTTVLKKNLEDYINAQLGEHKVAKAKLDEQIKKANDMAKLARNHRIYYETQIEDVDKELAAVDTNLDALRKAMTQAQADIKEVQSTGTPISKGAEKYDLVRLQKAATDLVAKNKAQKQAKAAKEERKATLVSRKEIESQREAELAKRVAAFKAEMENINNLMEDLSKHQEMAAAIGDPNADVSETFNEIEKEIKSLKSKVTVATRISDEDFKKMNEGPAPVSEGTKYLETSTASDPLADLEKELEGK